MTTRCNELGLKWMPTVRTRNQLEAHGYWEGLRSFASPRGAPPLAGRVLNQIAREEHARQQNLEAVWDNSTFSESPTVIT